MLATAGAALAEQPLHERIDALIESAAVGPIAPPASDADFLRRVSLDLTGVIPTAAEARAFLTDPASDKRVRLIDRLLASPQYARHMAVQWDVILLERRADKHVKASDWEQYLRASFATNKPLDQLFREFLTSDGADDATRPASRFLLNRDCEPNIVTRDIGRMFFGMDLQCAQCHDHPLIEDYYQADYYGLFAFVGRSGVYADAEKKVTVVSEKADGEASFKSVFTGNAADKVTPRLPKGAVLFAEPVFAKGEEYAVKPDKTVRGIPKFSRRAKLAEMLAESREFQRNIANRLWAQMFGRGIVHPVDFHHTANPPSNPQLLSLLADELVKSKFDAQAMLRQLALTRAYQRTCDAPRPAEMSLPEPDELLAQVEAQRPALAARIDELKAELSRIKAERKAADEQFGRQKGELAALETAAKAAQAAADKALAEQKSAEESLAKKQEQATLVSNAAIRTSVPAKKFPDDKAVADAFGILDQRAKALAAEVEAATKVVAEVAAKAKDAVDAATSAQTALAAAAKQSPAEMLAKFENQIADCERQITHTRYALAGLEGQIAAVKAAAEFEARKDDPSASEPAFVALVDRWTNACQMAPLKPLSCEQFALSIMQATGVLGQQAATFKASAEKSWPAAMKDVPESERPAALEDYVEMKTFEAVRGSLDAFIKLYGTQPGADFQATVNQALFFENGAVVQSWLSPAAGNLTDRLAKTEDLTALAEELYLSVLTRLPTTVEMEQVAGYLKDRKSDRPQAVGEMIWALVSSNEFRFNH